MNLKFIADVMLGRLAKWLRILGLDTVYNANYSDNEIIFIANFEKRFVLTRDLGLFERLGNQKSLLIGSDNVYDQISQVIKALNIEVKDNLLFSRCVICNSKLSSGSIELAEKKVPPYILQNHRDFKYCKMCNKFFWQGTHIDRIICKIKELY